MEDDLSQAEDFKAVQLNTLKHLFKSVDAKFIEEQFKNADFDFSQTKEIIRVYSELNEHEEQKAEQDFDSKSNGDQETEEIDMEKYLISESSDDESECDEDADEKNCQVSTKNWKKLNTEELPDINRIQINDEVSKQVHHKESRKARKRRKQQEAKRSIKDFRKKEEKVNVSQQNSELFTLLQEYSNVIRPEIRFCKYKLRKALKYKNAKASCFYKEKIRELQEVFMMYQKQAVEIKLESNSTDLERNTIDLHSLTLFEALLIVKEFIIQKRRELK